MTLPDGYTLHFDPFEIPTFQGDGVIIKTYLGIPGRGYWWDEWLKYNNETNEQFAERVITPEYIKKVSSK
jgi:hypothetical protein